MAKKQEDLMQKIVSFCKRRGFIYPSSEIYGGFANSYSYGPYGTELKNNLKWLWWKKFVQDRVDMVGIDGPILLNPRLWEASGHTSGFNDTMVDCKGCKKRFRADHLIEAATSLDLEGDIARMAKALKEKKINCPECGQTNWTEPRNLNLMFTTTMNGVEGPVYLRPETAGAIFVDFKNVIDSMRVKIPFGIAQIGKAFRNEIVAGNFIFRLREFEQMEIEYFIDPEAKWEKLFDWWLKEEEEFALALGADKKDLRRFEHPKEKLSHYSRKTVDIEYNFPFGFSELYGLAHRGDFDLSQHAKASGQDLSYFDQTNNRKYLPHVLEPTFGVDRSILVALCAAYHEEEVEGEIRTVLKFPPALAPVKIAVFPLLKNKAELVVKAKEIFDLLKDKYFCEFDDNGNVGKRYRRQDEIGTPYCVTIDFDTLEDKMVTVRDRDSMKQERVAVAEVVNYFNNKFSN
ncbi:MAG TPA: glycine--tRNA ligase [bacterium]|nr:glycine--tRNA ligase [bacterium]HOH67195.1 glycine--tRNA ligase [bacterium]HQA64070.1 glycine--tRNA ligase [bacterium]